MNIPRHTAVGVGPGWVCLQAHSLRVTLRSGRSVQQRGQSFSEDREEQSPLPADGSCSEEGNFEWDLTVKEEFPRATRLGWKGVLGRRISW